MKDPRTLDERRLGAIPDEVLNRIAEDKAYVSFLSELETVSIKAIMIPKKIYQAGENECRG